MLTCSSSLMFVGRHWVQGSLSSGVHSFLFNPILPPVSVWISSTPDSDQGHLIGLPSLMFPLQPRFHINGDVSSTSQVGPESFVVLHSLSWDTLPVSFFGAWICEAHQMLGPGGIPAGVGRALSRTGVYSWGDSSTGEMVEGERGGG